MSQGTDDWEQSGVETQALLIARVRDVMLRPPVILDPTASLRDAASAMREHDSSCVLVGALDNPGIVTSTDLRDALALSGLSPDSALGSLARRPLVTIESSALLLDALIQMQRCRVKRLLVTDSGRLDAVMELGDALSFLANHSNAVLQVVTQASDPTDLKPAFKSLVRLISALLRIGMKSERIGRLASDVNRAVFRRVFELVMPAQLQSDVCLIVMGSEGRREQILPTDQDNALIVRDGIAIEAVMSACATFSEALAEIGYPLCTGNVMVSNPYWVLTQSGFRRRISDWIVSSGNDDVINLAIFYDAAAVAGDERLLQSVKQGLFEVATASDAFFARFASATNTFPVPMGHFSRLIVERTGEHAGTLDLKKGGVFPIVHGVRSLALQCKLTTTGTLDRIEALVSSGTIEKRFGRELAEAFGFLCMLRAEAGLVEMEAGKPATNRIRPADLSQIDQEVLAESLRVVMTLRKLVSQHFRLDLLGF